MDPALRTRRLADSLKDVAFAFTFTFFLSRVPFASVVVCSYLAMGLADLGRLVDGAGRSALRVAAVLAVAAGLLTTADVWVDSRWLPAGYALAMGVGVLLATVGYSRVALELGGAARWQRARAGGIATACACCVIAGLMLQTPPSSDNFGTIELSAYDDLVAIPSMGVLAVGVLFVAIAASDLRDRVKAAVARLDAGAAAAAEFTPLEHVSG